jgi:hypothetical protein
MAVKYSWVINALDSYPDENGKKDVVFRIHWHREAADGAKIVDTYGAQEIELLAGAPFTPYDALTKAQVESWLETALGAEMLAAIKDHLDARLAEITSVPVVKPLPWA